jgi:hypothetical protein
MGTCCGKAKAWCRVKIRVVLENVNSDCCKGCCKEVHHVDNRVVENVIVIESAQNSDEDDDDGKAEEIASALGDLRDYMRRLPTLQSPRQSPRQNQAPSELTEAATGVEEGEVVSV